MAWTARQGDEIREHEEPGASVAAKAKALADCIAGANSVVFFTGAGISTSAGIPDFRGPQGVWTLKAEGRRREAPVTNMMQAVPTDTHMAIVALQRAYPAGKVRVISQNVDGLHVKSGLDPAHLAELHGNANLEVCDACGKRYMRDWGVRTAVHVNDHHTGRTCVAPGCTGSLVDTIVNFGENLPQRELSNGFAWSDAADVHVCLGSSLTVSPACKMPKATAKRGGKLCIVNLQSTPLDAHATPELRLFARTDDVMRLVMQHLGIAIQGFRLRRRLRVTPTVGRSSDEPVLRIQGLDGEDCPLSMLRAVKCGPDVVVEEPFEVGAMHTCASAQGWDVDLMFYAHYGEPELRLHVTPEQLASGAVVFALTYDPESGQWTSAVEAPGHPEQVSNEAVHPRPEHSRIMQALQQRSAVASSAPADTTFSGATSMAQAARATAACASRRRVVVAASAPGSPGDACVVRHNALCNECRGIIVGVRHKCRTCRDYDVCASCLAHLGEFHNEDHPFDGFARELDEAEVARLDDAKPATAPRPGAVAKPSLSVFQGGGFSVHPIDDCAHVALCNPLSGPIHMPAPCSDCHDASESWICLTCHQAFCSRYVNGHGVQHYLAEHHPLMVSLSDLSVWCHSCQEYVRMRETQSFVAAAHEAKFGL